MHSVQQKIINISRSQDISKLSLRELGKLIGETHPQKIKYHKDQLEKDGLLNLKSSQSTIKTLKKGKTFNKDLDLVEIPILGEANCGIPTIFANEEYMGSIKVSSSLIPNKSDLFALVARGDSMNDADIDNKAIEDGDYVIVDPNQTTPRSGRDYIISIIEGSANVKKYYEDREHSQIILVSESLDTKRHQPIFIPMDEATDYLVNGVVVQVVKAQTLNKN